jgi:hypothetical protein
MTSSLSKLIRLAYARPATRKTLSPALRLAKEFATEEALKKYLQEHPKADRKNHTVKPSEKGDGKKSLDGDVPSAAVEAFKKEIPEYQLEIIAGDRGTPTEEDIRRAKAVHAQMRRGISESADVCKLNPSVCTQNLGIARAHMPQIPEDSVKKLLASKDPIDRKKGEAAVKAGADPKDDRPMTAVFVDFLKKEKIKVTEPADNEPVPVGKLKATQKEIKAGKTFGIAEAYFKGKYDPTDAPIIVSSDNYILDGHHRWSAMLTADPEAKMKVRRIHLPMKEVLEKSFSMPGVYRMDLQDNPVDDDAPLDLARKPGDVWQQRNKKWYAKSKDGKTSGPYASKDSASASLKGSKKKASLKKAMLAKELIRVAYANPSLRASLLSIVKDLS